MSLYSTIDPAGLVGREMESLTFEERLALSGHWVAHEMYSPKTLPVRRIEAVGESASDCARQITASGRDPKKFEFVRLDATA